MRHFSTHKWIVIVLHLGLLLIAVGALVTWRCRKELHLTLSAGEEVHEPFSFRLERFDICYYPGTTTPEDYCSTLLLDNGDTAQIAMNQPLRYHGWRVYQMGYVPETEASLLMMSYDPWGTALVYTGYLLSLLSMLLQLCRPWMLRIRKRRRQAGMLCAIGLLLGLSSQAQATPQVVQRPLAETFGDLYVEYNGRICPMSTLATDVCINLFGTNGYTMETGEKLTANQVLMSMFFYYDSWQDVPLRHSRKPKKNEQRELIRRMVGNGSLMRIWTGPAGWYDINTTYPGDSLPDEDRLFRTYVLHYVMHDMQQGQFRSANETLQKLRRYQQQCSAQLPSERKIQAEKCYTRWPFPRPLLLRWYITGHIPLSNGAELMQGLFLLTIFVSILLLIKRLWTMAAGVILMAIAFLGVSYMSSASPQLTHLQPVLNSPLLCLHVSVIMISYVLFALLLVMSITALIMGHKRENIRKQLQQQSHRILSPACFLLALGIVLGSLWANVSWGRYWGWDPKETCALLTLLIYIAPAHTRVRRFLSPTGYHIYCALAFLMVLFTYFGVNFVLGGLHAYA